MNIQREIGLFQRVYEDAMYAPLLRWNPKFKTNETNEFDGMTPYICLNDICNYNYVVCAIPDEEVTMMLQERFRRKVIAKYDTLEEMVKDGWILDT